MQILFILLSHLFLAPAAEARDSGFYLEARCWLDDDADFTPGQTDAGLISGRDAADLQEICQLMAKGRGSDWSSGLTDIRQRSGHFDFHLEARCWLDDDADFTPGQIDAGTVMGNSGRVLSETCNLMAKGRGSDWSSGLADIRQVSGRLRFHYEARCWLDDDADFTPGQIDAGAVKGRSAQDLKETCDLIAKGRGKDWTSGLTEIRQIQGRLEIHLQARCWLDDDADFTPGQIDAGNILGIRAADLAETCDLIAKGRGKDWTSGVTEITQKSGRVKLLFEARCWLDDDADFTPGQIDGGAVFGRSGHELSEVCNLIAKGRGSDWTSALTDIRQKVTTPDDGDEDDR